MAGLAGQNFGNRDAFVLSLVRQHRAGHDIADRIDALQAGGEMRIDLDAAPIVERNARFLQAKTFGERYAADANQNDVSFDLLSGPSGRGIHLRDQRLARVVDAGDLGAELERKPLLLEDALELFCSLAVHTGQDAVEKFDHSDLRAQPVPDRAEFKPDNAGTDDQELARHLVERQRAGRRHDALLVDFDALEACDIGAGGDDDILGLDNLRLAVVAGDLDLASTEDFSLARDDVDLILLHQELDALDVTVDALLLEVHHRRQIEFRRRDANAHLGKGMRGFFEHFGGVQQRL